ncbi:MAG TPA: hypothetical protein ENK91_01950 [Bacteroidetes bacterium]|nr:hypothetical protein [Bacteroidota bacterium]
MQNQNKPQAPFPFKPMPLIFGLVAWNIFFLFDIFTSGMLGPGAMLALSMLLISSILLLISSDFRKSVLNEGVELERMKKNLYLSIAVAGIVLLVLIYMSFK